MEDLIPTQTLPLCIGLPLTDDRDLVQGSSFLLLSWPSVTEGSLGSQRMSRCSGGQCEPTCCGLSDFLALGQCEAYLYTDGFRGDHPVAPMGTLQASRMNL